MKALIKLVCGVSMTEQRVGKWLRRYGFAPAAPGSAFLRQQPERARAWLEEEYSAIASSNTAPGAAHRGTPPTRRLRGTGALAATTTAAPPPGPRTDPLCDTVT
ncbi:MULTISPECIES: winged helix-turn-helix domain-containing protein [unclassified Streptomyces]|uniref:winged helix-turn-helix domain-containing protein n=1 Tax=unclassified Streptomyces TaxID=2593676 RepID=UPI00381D9833